MHIPESEKNANYFTVVAIGASGIDVARNGEYSMQHFKNASPKRL